MKFKSRRWFQALVVPLVALAFHIFFGYRVIGRENIPEGGCVCLSEPCAAVRPAVCGRSHSAARRSIRLTGRKREPVPEEDIRVADGGARRLPDLTARARISPP